MREIKFRVYNPRDNKVHYDITGFEFINKCEMSGVFIDGAFFLKEEVELMQYTGLKDKNGKEIYEGDIVKADFFEKQVVGKISYGMGCFCITNSGVSDNQLFIFNNYEVIGNIYENPELLKGE